MRSLDGAPPPLSHERLDIGAAISTGTERWFSRVARHEYDIRDAVRRPRTGLVGTDGAAR